VTGASETKTQPVSRRQGERALRTQEPQRHRHSHRHPTTSMHSILECIYSCLVCVCECVCVGEADHARVEADHALCVELHDSDLHVRVA
jgi:hypothetical protein